MFAAAVLASAAIFHGAPATNAPWFASLEQGGAFCSGSLIAPDRVLTAAHCVQGAGPGSFDAHIGGSARAVKAIYFPPTYRLIPSPVEPDVYSASGSVNDVAIVILKQPVTDVAPLPVATTPAAVGEPTMTVGRGTTDADGELPARALQATQRSIDCSSLYPPSLLHTKLHLCTQDPTPTKAQACAGDSGGAGDGHPRRRAAGRGRGHLGRRDARARVRRRPGGRLRAPAPARRAGHRPGAQGGRALQHQRGADRHARASCHRGSWLPRSTTFKIRYFKRGGRKACRVTARTPGGWSDKESYNEV